MTTKKQRTQSPKAIYCLYTNDWELFGVYESYEEAVNDVAGPVFRPKFRVIEFERVKTKTHNYRNW